MKTCFMIAGALLLSSSYAVAADNCTASKKKAVCSDELVQAKTKAACDLVTSKGQAALTEIKKMRFDCCGEPDYVWINTYEFDSAGKPKPKMVMHPMKPMLDGKDVTMNKDPDGKFLFIEFVNALKASPTGAWVNYKWTKLGEKDPTDKKSWVMKCKPAGSQEEWVVGSGTWL